MRYAVGPENAVGEGRFFGQWATLPGELSADTAAGCPVAIGAAYTALPAGFYLLFDDDVDWDYIALSDAMNGPAAGKTDFATIALHEAGHVVGLLHTPGDPANHIMRASITGDARNGNFNRTIENDSALGAAELYTVTRGIRTDTPGLPPRRRIPQAWWNAIKTPVQSRT